MAPKQSKPKNPSGRRARAGGPTRVIGVRFSDSELEELNDMLVRVHANHFDSLSAYIRWAVLPSRRVRGKERSK